MKIPQILVIGVLSLPLLVGNLVSCTLFSAECAPANASPNDPERAEELLRRGREAYAQQAFQAAIAHYTAAIALNPDLATAYALRGSAHFASQDYGGAVEDSSQAIALNPDLAESYGIRGLARQALGNEQGAVEDLWQAAELFREQGDQQGYARAIMAIKLVAP